MLSTMLVLRIHPCQFSIAVLSSAWLGILAAMFLGLEWHFYQRSRKKHNCSQRSYSPYDMNVCMRITNRKGNEICSFMEKDRDQDTATSFIY